MKGKIPALLKYLLLIYLVAGAVLFVGDALHKRVERERYLYMDVELWREGSIELGRIEGEEKIDEMREAFRSIQSAGGVVWFGVPELEIPCPLKVRDAYEEKTYKLCRGKGGGWYVVLPGSYKGRDTVRYFSVPEDRAISLLKKAMELSR